MPNDIFTLNTRIFENPIRQVSKSAIFTGKKPKSKEQVGFIDYGIPPDSETY